MTKEELIDKIEEIIKLDGDKFSDGEIIDLIDDLIKKEKIKK